MFRHSYTIKNDTLDTCRLVHYFWQQYNIDPSTFPQSIAIQGETTRICISYTCQDEHIFQLRQNTFSCLRSAVGQTQKSISNTYIHDKMKTYFSYAKTQVMNRIYSHIDQSKVDLNRLNQYIIMVQLCIWECKNLTYIRILSEFCLYSSNNLDQF